MEAFYNQEKNQYILATNRSGTFFLASNTVRNLGWGKVDVSMSDLNIDKDAYVFNVVRDPFQRWCSWFDNFVLADSPKLEWNMKRAADWIKEFKVTLSEDAHTQKQSIFFNLENVKHEPSRTFYVKMEDLNLFLGLSNQRHQTAGYERFRELPESVQHYFETEIKIVYQDDYNWIKKLQTLTF
jgi:hypothetical protein